MLHNSKEKLHQLLITSCYEEGMNLHDNFEEISPIVAEYKKEYGCDEWINRFTSNYLKLRQYRHLTNRKI